MDDLLDLLPEGTRIVISGNKVTFENLTPDMLEIAHALNPDDEDIKARLDAVTESKNTNDT
ncbi:MAG: hypothetical protein IIY06_00620 [Proteobacteria bacterium]|jgi:hypothetical protein|nr:hypothetical protein [Pseudomonadota bacterium]